MVRKKLVVNRSGYIRKPYSRKPYFRSAYTRKDGTRVKSARVGSSKVGRTKVGRTTFKIKDLGAPGRGRKVIKKITPGLLKKHGYSTKLSQNKRRAALRKADRDFGSVSLFRKLQAQVVLRKRTQPKAVKVFKSDRDWVERELLSKREARSMTSKPRKKWKSMSSIARAKAMPGGKI